MMGSCKGSMQRKGIRVFLHEERAVGLWAGSDLRIQGLAFRSLSKSIDCVILLFILEQKMLTKGNWKG